MLTTLDMSILEILYADARVPASQIAVMTGHDESEVRKSIAALEEQKIILKYPALINWDKASDRVEAIIEVRVTPQRDQGFDAIASRIYRYEEVRSVYLMSGAYDLCVIVEAQNMRQLAFFVAEKLSTLDSVLSTATHFILKKYKKDGVIFEGEPQSDGRLAVSP